MKNNTNFITDKPVRIEKIKPETSLDREILIRFKKHLNSKYIHKTDELLMVLSDIEYKVCEDRNKFIIKTEVIE